MLENVELARHEIVFQSVKRLLPKTGFPLANFYARSDFFFCLSLISSTWFQPKAQEQREKSRFAGKYSLMENRLKFLPFYAHMQVS